MSYIAASKRSSPQPCISGYLTTIWDGKGGRTIKRKGKRMACSELWHAYPSRRHVRTPGGSLTGPVLPMQPGFDNYMKENLRNLWDWHSTNYKLQRFQLRNVTFCCFLLKEVSGMGSFCFVLLCFFEWDVLDQQSYYKDFTSNTETFLKVKTRFQHPGSRLHTSHGPSSLSRYHGRPAG